jgi:hypothetical protein
LCIDSGEYFHIIEEDTEEEQNKSSEFRTSKELNPSVFQLE